MHGFTHPLAAAADRPPPPPGRHPRRHPARPRPPRPVRLHPPLQRLVGGAALAQGRLLGAPTASPASPSSTATLRAAAAPRRPRRGRALPPLRRPRAARPRPLARSAESATSDPSEPCKFLRFSCVHRPMAFVETISQLWQRKLLVGARSRARRRGGDPHAPTGSAPAGLRQAHAAGLRGLEPDPRRLAQLDAGRRRLERSTFEALATRAKIYGQYLSSLAARRRNRQAGRGAGRARSRPAARSAPPPARSATNPSPPANGPTNCCRKAPATASSSPPRKACRSSPSSSQAATTDTRDRPRQRLLHDAAQTTSTASRPTASRSRRGVTVRELGAPEGGTLGGSNDMILMVLAFLARLRPRLRRDPDRARLSPAAGARSTTSTGLSTRPIRRSTRTPVRPPIRRPTHAGHGYGAPRRWPSGEPAGAAEPAHRSRTSR